MSGIRHVMDVSSDIRMEFRASDEGEDCMYVLSDNLYDTDIMLTPEEAKGIARFVENVEKHIMKRLR